MSKIKYYRNDHDYSYILGAFGTIELINSNPNIIQAVYIHTSYRDKNSLAQLCQSNGIKIYFDDSIFKRISQKENHHVIAVFKKYSKALMPNEPHIVLVNPSDMGNLGTILRVSAGCCINNIAIILPSADIWHPKTVRASMGALFKINFQSFESFECYRSEFAKHICFPFMLDGETVLDFFNIPKTKMFSLIFGNEAAGLNESYNTIGTSIKIPQSNAVDSLNLSVAVGIGAFAFAKNNGLI